MQMQQQFMTTMLVMMSGRVGVPFAPLPMIPPMDMNEASNNIVDTGLNNTRGEGKTTE